VFLHLYPRLHTNILLSPLLPTSDICYPTILFHHTVVWLGYLVYCAFVCTVTDFSAVEKDSGVKLRMLYVPLLSGMSFSHFGELWPRGAVWLDLRFADALVCLFVCFAARLKKLSVDFHEIWGICRLWTR